MLRRRWWVVVAGVVVLAVAVVIVAGQLIPACGTSVAAVGCAEPNLALRQGVSVVTGKGRLTGVVRTRFGTPLHEFEIRDVKVLAGPARAATLRAWLATVPDPGPNLAAAQVPGLWAPDGQLMAYVSRDPAAVGESSTVLVRPVVAGEVVFSAADCGSAPAVPPTVKFEDPLAEVPNSRSYTVARCNGGFAAAPLSEVNDYSGDCLGPSRSRQGISRAGG